MDDNGVVVEVKGVKTHFFTDEGIVKAVDGVDITIHKGKMFCVVGESGCGKSVSAFSILQIVEKPGRIVEGNILYHRTGQEVIDLAKLDPRDKKLRSIRGREISMVFQEPMSSLSPVHTIGNQIIEAIRLHTGALKDEAREIAIEALNRVGMPKPRERIDAYPFQLSGGMRQRAMIAMALSCRPKMLIADEPTTALDVTMQAVILDLIKELQSAMGMAVMFITHDLGVVAEIADDVAVMYLGRVVESGSADEIFNDPRHPYTEALLKSIPMIGLTRQQKLETITGMVPHPFNRPTGCTFHPRCGRFMPGVCDRIVPPITQLENGRTVRCLLYGGREGAAGGERSEDAIE
jgi:peptide/nickel transport system ATP-binding protein